MTQQGDDRLLQQLCDADAQSSPPAGRAITPASLRERLVQRRNRSLAAATALVLLVAGLCTWWPATIAAHDTADGELTLRREADLLSARVDQLLAQLAVPPVQPFTADAPEAFASQLRLELATARVRGLPSPTDPTEKR